MVEATKAESTLLSQTAMEILLDNPVPILNLPLEYTTNSKSQVRGKLIGPDGREIDFRFDSKTIIEENEDEIHSPSLGTLPAEVKMTVELQAYLPDIDATIISDILYIYNYPSPLVALVAEDKVILEFWLSADYGILKWTWEDEEEVLSRYLL